jgi:hypothetical protein
MTHMTLEELEVICDPESSRIQAFNAKFEEFVATLTEEERAYVDFVRRAADVAAIEHGRSLYDDAEQFEDQIRLALGDAYVSYDEPQMGGIVIRTTAMTRCATWLLRC